MDILFASDRDKRLYNDSRALVKRYGSQRARLIRLRLDQMRAAACLEVCRSLPGHYHELKYERAGQVGASLDYPYRIVIEQAHEPPRLLAGGGLDWPRIEVIRVISVEDYHD